MKKRLSNLIIIMIIIFPISVFAAGNITVSPTSLIIGEGRTKTFSITSTNVIGDVTIKSSDSNVATVNVSEWETGMIEEGQTKTGNITVTGVSAGTATITLTIDGATFDSEDLSGQTRTVNVTVKKFSDNNNLSNLEIDGTIISGFNAVTTTYSVETEKSSIAISAVAEDSTASVVGTGTKTLKYGDNKFEIKVTAENDTVKTYTVNINRKDNRDTNNYLANLTIDKGFLTFDKNTTSYTLNIDNNIEKITINATPESAKSKVTGIGEKSLKVGNNKFEIKVTAENGKVKTYTININKLEKDDSNFIKSLSIEDISLDFDPNVLEYNIVIKDQTSLKFNYELEDGVVAEIEGNNDLEDGSVIILKLTKNDKTKEYKFNVTKENEVVPPSDEEVTPNQEIVAPEIKKEKKWIRYVTALIILLDILGIVYIIKKKKNQKTSNAFIDPITSQSEMSTIANNSIIEENINQNNN